MDVADVDAASNNSVEDVRRMQEDILYPPLKQNTEFLLLMRLICFPIQLLMQC